MACGYPKMINFEKGVVWIKWIGSHAGYDRIDVKGVKHGD